MFYDSSKLYSGSVFNPCKVSWPLSSLFDNTQESKAGANSNSYKSCGCYSDSTIDIPLWSRLFRIKGETTITLIFQHVFPEKGMGSLTQIWTTERPHLDT